jgi:hypothetical protein
MRLTCLVILFLIPGLLFTTTTRADDAPVNLTPAAKAFIADLERASDTRFLTAIPNLHYSDEFLRLQPDINFEDNSLLARLSELRKVSFLTLLNREDARLFLGVNDKGIVGLHFSGYRQ